MKLRHQLFRTETIPPEAIARFFACMCTHTHRTKYCGRLEPVAPGSDGVLQQGPPCSAKFGIHPFG
jgi:hypothetical protein